MSATDLAPIVAERDLWDRGSRLIEHISTVALSKDSASERRHPPSRSPKCVYKASHRPRSSRHRQQGRAQPQRGPQNHRRRCRGTRASNRHLPWYIFRSNADLYKTPIFLCRFLCKTACSARSTVHRSSSSLALSQSSFPVMPISIGALVSAFLVLAVKTLATMSMMMFFSATRSSLYDSECSSAGSQASIS